MPKEKRTGGSNKTHISLHNEQKSQLDQIKTIEGLRSYNEVIIALILTYEHKFGNLPKLWKQVQRARGKPT